LRSNLCSRRHNVGVVSLLIVRGLARRCVAFEAFPRREESLKDELVAAGCNEGGYGGVRLSTWATRAKRWQEGSNEDAAVELGEFAVATVRIQ